MSVMSRVMTSKIIAPILLFLALGTSCAGCPKDAYSYGNSCYNVVRVNATWAEALAYCNDVGSQLAMIETAEEQAFIVSLLTNMADTIDTVGVWLAGLDYLVEGDWQWAYQGKAISKFFWSRGNLNDLSSKHRGQDCLMMFKEVGFKWDDNYCSEPQFFLCETEQATNP